MAVGWRPDHCIDRSIDWIDAGLSGKVAGDAGNHRESSGLSLSPRQTKNNSAGRCHCFRRGAAHAAKWQVQRGLGTSATPTPEWTMARIEWIWARCCT